MYSKVDDKHKVSNQKPYLFTLYSPISSTRVEEGARENTDELYQLAFYDDGTFRLMQQIFIDNKLIREFEPNYSLIKTIEWGWGYIPDDNGKFIYHELFDDNGRGICLRVDQEELTRQFHHFLARM